MNVTFFDRQELANPINGIEINAESRLRHILDSLSSRRPFFCELVGDNSYKLLIGVGGLLGCIQHSATNEEPPYLMAVSESQSNNEDYAEFLIGSTITPISMRYCMPFTKIKEIAIYFLRGGERDPSVKWEEI